MIPKEIADVLSGTRQWCVTHGDCLDVLRTMPDNCVDALVCDPPCGINFMNLEFDSDRGGRDNWIAWLTEIIREVARVMKPGAHGFVWALPRTSHWTGMALENAGLQPRDVATHLFSTGFPKSSKAGRLAVEAIHEIYGGKSCTCEMDAGIGCIARYDAGRDVGRENGLLAQPNSGQTAHIGDSDVQVSSRTEGGGVYQLRNDDEETTQGIRAVEAAVLLDGMRGGGAEKERLRDAPVRTGLESQTQSGAGEGQDLPMLREDAKGKRRRTARAPHSSVSDRRQQQYGEPDGTLRQLPSYGGVGDDEGDRLDQDRCHPRRVVAHRLAWRHGGVAHVCSWCGLPDRAWFDGVANQGSALKPAAEFWWLVRKPFKGSLISNVLKHGTGGLNIDACRVPHANASDFESHASGVAAIKARGGSMGGSWKNSSDLSGANDVTPAGRWPSNLTFSHGPFCKRVGVKKVKAAPPWNDNRGPSMFTGPDTSPVVHAEDDGMETVDEWECSDECVVAELNRQSGQSYSSSAAGVERHGRSAGIMGRVGDLRDGRPEGHDDAGGASRFFNSFEPDEPIFLYQAKPARSEREAGLEQFMPSKVGDGRAKTNDTPYLRDDTERLNTHATVKSVALMRWLCRLVTPPKGVVLDIFAGSGSTGVACSAEGFRFIGIEKEKAYVDIARARIVGDNPLFNLVGASR